MQRAVVLSGRGKCGRAISARLVEAGFAVTATTAGAVHDAPAMAGVTWSALDRAVPYELGTTIGPGADVVVDTMCMDEGDARRLVAVGDSVGAAVVLSTASVYTDDVGRSLDEATGPEDFPRWPVPIPESQATLAPSGATYSTSKAAVEAHLSAHATFPVAVLRCGAIHGPFARDLREWFFIKRVLDGRPRVVLPHRGASRFGTTATVNLAAMVLACATARRAVTLNCADPDQPTVSEICSAICTQMGHEMDQVLFDWPPPTAGLGAHPWRVPRPVVLDTSRATTEVGYRPVATYPESLGETVAWATGATSTAPWHEVLPQFAAYYPDAFDYAREDAFCG